MHTHASRCGHRSLVTFASLLSITLPLVGQYLGSLPAGAVKGTVVDDTGKPVLHARVFISRALPAASARPAAPPVITGPHVITTMTDHSGQFISGHLSPGNYIACAQYAAQGLLDPCHWAASAPIFTVTAGKTATGVTVPMTKGAIVSIHVSDPQQTLVVKKGAPPPPLRFHMVTAKGHHYEAAMVSHDATSQDYRITIPFATPLTLQVMAPNLAVNDETGKPVATAAASPGRPVTVPVGATAATTFTYTIAGAK